MSQTIKQLKQSIWWMNCNVMNFNVMKCNSFNWWMHLNDAFQLNFTCTCTWLGIFN